MEGVDGFGDFLPDLLRMYRGPLDWCPSGLRHGDPKGSSWTYIGMYCVWS